MKIGIFTDLRFTSLSTPTGVTKHIIHMIDGLYHHPGIELIVLAAKDQLNKDGSIPPNNALSYLKARPLPYSWHRIYWQSFFLNAPHYDQYTSDLDWVYCLKNDYLPLKQTKYAVTFHGAHELDPYYPNPQGLKAYLTKKRSLKSYQRMVNQAQLILTVSEFLKQKTIEWFNASSSNIAVVGNGVEDEFFRSSFNYQPNNYFITVGGLNFLDGGDRIIELAQQMKTKGIHREIWVAGNQHENNLLQAAQGHNNIKLLGYLPKELLAEVMSNASALLFLTRYETFGIAAAEAMAIGLPVITNKNTAVAEIVMDAGIYVNPEKLNISEIETELKSKHLEMIQKGKEIANNYHWKNCSSKLIKAIQDK